MTEGALCNGAKVLRNFWLAAVMVLAAGSIGPVQAGAPPPTTKDQTVDTMHGVRVSDPYRWLENSKDPAVQKWSDEQNAFTRDYVRALPVHAKLTADLGTLIKATSPSFSALQVRGDHVFAHLSRTLKCWQSDSRHVERSTGSPARSRSVIDPNSLDPAGLTRPSTGTLRRRTASKCGGVACRGTAARTVRCMSSIP